MKRHRLRCVTKWTGLAVCVAMLALWFVSRWRWPVVMVATLGGLRSVGIEGGVLIYRHQAPNQGFPLGWSFEFLRVRVPAWTWVPIPYWWSSGVGVPLCLPFVLIGTATGFFFYRDRRAARREPGACARCGYSLAGNTTGVCPECGTAVQA